MRGKASHFSSPGARKRSPPSRFKPWGWRPQIGCRAQTATQRRAYGQSRIIAASRDGHADIAVRYEVTSARPFCTPRMPLKVCQLCAVDFTLKHFLTPLIDGMRNRSTSGVIAPCSEIV